MNALDFCDTEPPFYDSQLADSRAEEHDCTIYEWNYGDGSLVIDPAASGHIHFPLHLKHGNGVWDLKCSEALRNNGNTLDSQ
jgi:hypothetical protein